MGLDFYQCHICSTGYEAQYLHYIPIKEYDDSIRICTSCRSEQFVASPRHGYIDLEPTVFTAHYGTEFTDFSDLSEHLEGHSGKAKCTQFDTFMDIEELYEKCEHYSWEQLEEQNEDNTKWTPTEEFWRWEKRQITADLERLKKRQKIINDMIH